MDEADDDVSSDLNELDLGENEKDVIEASESKETMYDYLFNVIIVGDSGVGKTDLVGRLCNEDYETKFVTTMGMNVESHILEVSDKKIKLQIWDPSGSEKYMHLTKKYFSNASGIVYVYDITYAKSFNNIIKWIDLVNKNADGSIPKFLVGNKCDIRRRAVTIEQGEKLSKSSGMGFLETSAVTGLNVPQVFSSLCEVMMSLEDQKFAAQQM